MHGGLALNSEHVRFRSERASKFGGQKPAWKDPLVVDTSSHIVFVGTATADARRTRCPTIFECLDLALSRQLCLLVL